MKKQLQPVFFLACLALGRTQTPASSCDLNAVIVTNANVRRIAVYSATVTTWAGRVTNSYGTADGTGTVVGFCDPRYVAASPDGKFALIADHCNHAIRKLNISTGVVTTLVGHIGSAGTADGYGTNVYLSRPIGVAMSPDGTYALISEYGRLNTNAYGNSVIRRIRLNDTAVVTVAGQKANAGYVDGIGTNAQFNGLQGISISPDGTFALMAEDQNNVIRQFNISTNAVTTLVGKGSQIGYADGNGTNVLFNSPAGISISPDGKSALVTDWNNYVIRKIIIASSQTTTFAGSSNGINNPYHVTYAPDGTFCLVGDGYYIKKLNISTLAVTPLVGSGSDGMIDGVGSNVSIQAGSMSMYCMCSAGLYAAIGACLQCPAGTYAPVAGSCMPCSPGNYSMLPGSTACTVCQLNTVSNFSGATACIPCGGATYQSRLGATACLSCDPVDPSSPEAAYCPCRLPQTVNDLVAANRSDLVTGGLGSLAQPGVYTWWCLALQCVTVGQGDLACFKYNETGGAFSFWGPNSALHLVRP